SRLGRWKEYSIWLVVDAFRTPEYTDKAIHLVIPGFHVIVTYWPVVTETINAPALKIIWTKTQGDTTPVICPSSEHTSPEPIELRSILPCIGFPFEFPAAIRGVKVTERSQRCTRTPSC